MTRRPIRLVFPGKSIVALYWLHRLSVLQSAAERPGSTSLHTAVLRARAALLAGSLAMLGVEL